MGGFVKIVSGVVVGAGIGSVAAWAALSVLDGGRDYGGYNYHYPIVRGIGAIIGGLVGLFAGGIWAVCSLPSDDHDAKPN